MAVKTEKVVYSLISYFCKQDRHMTRKLGNENTEQVTGSIDKDGLIEVHSLTILDRIVGGIADAKEEDEFDNLFLVLDDESNKQ